MATPTSAGSESREVLNVRLFGSLQVRKSDGTLIEITSRKSRALFALLVLARGGERTRTWLQNMLWCRGSSQASLRRELSNLRSLFGEAGFNLFPKSVPKDVVRIDLDRISTDIDAGSADRRNEFLEGMDLPYEPEFEEWLRETRSYYRVHFSEAGQADTAGAPEAPRPAFTGLADEQADHRLCIGLTPVVWERSDAAVSNQAPLVDEIIDRIGRLLMSSGGIDLVDSRQSIKVPGIINPVASALPHVRLFCKASCGDRELSLSFQLVCTESDRVLISRSFVIETGQDATPAGDSEGVSGVVAELVNETLFCLGRTRIASLSDHSTVIRLVHEAVESMFRLTYEGLDKARENLDQAAELMEDSAVYAWRAFLTTQLIDDPRITDFDQIREEAIAWSARALELDRYNPLTLSLLTHVSAFTLKDLRRASELMSQAKAMRSDHFMTYDADSLLNLYLGDFDQSKESAYRAARLGRYLPFRYLFMTTLCMIEGLKGNYGSSIQAGEKALQLHPQRLDRPYPPTVRYLAQSYARVGQEEKAFEILGLLKQRQESIAGMPLVYNQRAAPTSVIEAYLKLDRNALT